MHVTMNCAVPGRTKWEGWFVASIKGPVHDVSDKLLPVTRIPLILFSSALRNESIIMSLSKEVDVIGIPYNFGQVSWKDGLILK